MEAFPAERRSLELRREMVLRYGENPHQSGGGLRDRGDVRGVRRLFRAPGQRALLEQFAGRRRRTQDGGDVRRCPAEAAVVIVKHNNPCGIGRGADLPEAYRRALATDPGVGLRRRDRPQSRGGRRPRRGDGGPLRGGAAGAGLHAEARERFAKKKNLRLIECPLYRPEVGEIELRALDGGFLAQPPDGYPMRRKAGRARRSASRPPRSGGPWSSPGRSCAT